jgi:stearoyl-CoA desaturase (delta-9 desaturase)
MKYHFLFQVAVAATLLAIGGFSMFLWGFCLRLICIYHFTWFVNSACHYWGYRPVKEELATNNWWVALVSFGEGWHNNHHAFPTSARHGMRFWEIDIAWMTIWAQKKLRLATKVHVPAKEDLPWNKAKHNKSVAN